MITPAPAPPPQRGGWLVAGAATAALAALFVVRGEVLRLVPSPDRLIAELGVFLLALLLGGLAIRAFVRRVFSHLSDGPLYGWRPVVTWGLYVILGLGVLSALQINLTGLLAAGAVVGVVLGVAAQTSLGSVFAGLVLLTARPFVVGNWVHVKTSLFSPVEYAGVVTHVGVIYTTLDVAGRAVRIPNSAMVVSALTVTQVPLQLDIELQLPPGTSLVQLARRLEEELHLTGSEAVTMLPLRLETAGDGQLGCQLQIRSHLPVDLSQVSRVILDRGDEGGKESAPD